MATYGIGWMVKPDNDENRPIWADSGCLVT